MRIEFGMHLDGAAWAEGVVRTGPHGLVRILQDRLALSRPNLEPAVRIARYAAAVRRADPPWPRASFARDPWATAATMLRWRDDAVIAGASLTPTPVLPERIAALAAIEQHLPPDAAGFADDLREIVEHLEAESEWPLGIEELLLHEEPTALPCLWSRLITALTAHGVPLHLHPIAAHKPELTIIEAEDAASAAEAAARHLRGRDPSSPLQILATSDTIALDQELHRRDLPALGVAEPSADRAALQVLPLYLAITTAPVDVQQVAAFLDLRVMDAPEGAEDHVGLVPAPARHRLQQALAQEPGIGGPAWRTAVTHLLTEATLSDGARDFLRALCDAVAAPLPAQAVTPDRLRNVLEPLHRRLRGLAQGTGHPLRAAVHLQTVLAVLDALDNTAPLRPREITQILTAAGGRAVSPLAGAEASRAWRVCTRPAQLLPLGGDVLWWGADRDTATGGEITWDATERAALESLGARLPAAADLAALATNAGLRGLHGARRLLVVRTRRRLEKPTAPHALLAHLAAERAADGEGISDVLDRLTIPVVRTLHGSMAEVAGSRITVRTPPPAQIPPRPEDLTKRAAPAPHLMPRRLSYSQAEDLIGCRQKWTYRNALRIRPAAASTVPTGNQMIGTLVHAVVESLVDTAPAEGRIGVPTPERIRQEITALVPRLASELELPGREVELADMTERAVRTLTEFFHRLADAGITITAVESAFEQPVTLTLHGRTEAIPFIGFRDVLGESADGHRVVIDLKWTYAAAKYPDLFDTGEALQLASYAWSLHDPDAEVGYYLLAQGEFVAANPALDPNGRTRLDVDGLWERGRRGIQEALESILDGEVSARSGQILLDAGQDLATDRSAAKKTYATARDVARDQDALVVDARCDYCDFSLLCGLRGDRS